MPRSSSLTMQRYSLEPRTRKYVVGYKFLWFARNYKIQLLKISRKILQKTEHVKKSKLLNDSIVSKCVIKN